MNVKSPLIVVLSLYSWFSFSQAPGRDSLNAWLIEAGISYIGTAGELGDRINSGSSAGIGVAYKTKKNWIWGVEASYLYSNNVADPEQVVSGFKAGSQRILNTVGNLANITIDQRGFEAYAIVRKTLPWLNTNPNSGLQAGFGAGATTFWYNVTSSDQTVPQIQDEYDKGYDRLSAGLALKQAISYHYLSPKRTINFRISLVLAQSFTEDLRGYNYSTAQKISGNQFSFTYGLKAHWILPIYQVSRGKEYFYD